MPSGRPVRPAGGRARTLRAPLGPARARGPAAPAANRVGLGLGYRLHAQRASLGFRKRAARALAGLARLAAAHAMRSAPLQGSRPCEARASGAPAGAARTATVRAGRASGRVRWGSSRLRPPCLPAGPGGGRARTEAAHPDGGARARRQADDDAKPVVGFCFSFPVRQTALDAGTVARLTKRFENAGLAGSDPVRMLSAALERASFPARARASRRRRGGAPARQAALQAWSERRREPAQGPSSCAHVPCCVRARQLCRRQARQSSGRCHRARVARGAGTMRVAHCARGGPAPTAAARTRRRA